MKKEQTDFKKHYLIPLILCCIIILIGIFMSITDTYTVGLTREYRYGQDRVNAGKINYALNGIQIISIGVIAATFVTFVWVKSKK